MTLKDLEIGASGVIIAVGGEGSLRQHFLDMGVIPGAEVTLMKYAPMGDPMELRSLLWVLRERGRRSHGKQKPLRRPRRTPAWEREENTM